MDSFKSPQGRVLEIQRMSTEDGPGLRTTVFFKGCPLACAWCHNPESIAPAPELVWEGTGCLGCGLCRDTCPNKALSLTDQGIVIDRNLCQACGLCADICPSASLVVFGQLWEVRDLVAELERDRAYFTTSGGGVTLSGGEACLQHGFILPVLKALKAAGIHTALDTCGMVSPAVLEGLLPYLDLILYDIKEMDPVRHKIFTGSSNARILDNLIRLSDTLKAAPGDLWIRTPIIPGATDREENIEGIAGFILTHLGDLVSRWELCAFNPLGRDKYTRLGKSWAYETCLSMAQDQMDRLVRSAVSAGIDERIVHATGPISVSDQMQVSSEKESAR